MVGRKVKASASILAIVLFSFLFSFATAQAQLKNSKPLLIVKVESENINLTQPGTVVPPNASELKELREMLSSDLSTIFEIIPETDKRDCIELSVVIEKLRSGAGFVYVGSSAIAVGKGDSDLLYTHNPIVQPTLKRISSALTFQLSTMQLQAFLGK